MFRGIIKKCTVFFSMFIALNVYSASPSTPILPSDNIQDPGSLSTPWGGCGPADLNCYVQLTSFNNETVEGLDYSTSTGVLSLTSGYTIPTFASTTAWNNALGASSDAILQNGNSFGNTLILGTNDNQALSFKTNGNDAMTILSNGNVGVGTTTPSTILSLGSGQLSAPIGSIAVPTYTFNGDLNTGMWSPSEDILAWSIGGNEIMRASAMGINFGTSNSIVSTSSQNKVIGDANVITRGESVIIYGDNNNHSSTVGGYLDNVLIGYANYISGGLIDTHAYGANNHLSGSGINSDFHLVYGLENILSYGNGESSSVVFGRSVTGTALDSSAIFANNFDIDAITALPVGAHETTVLGYETNALMVDSLGFSFLNEGTNLMTIKGTGNIGVGTTTPSAKLQVTGTAGSSNVFVVSSSTNAQMFTVAANGNVGIGTNTPTQTLHVLNAASGTTLQGRFANSSSTQPAGFHMSSGVGWNIIFRTIPNVAWFDIGDSSGNSQHQWSAKNYLLDSTGKIGFVGGTLSNSAPGAYDVYLDRVSAGTLRTVGSHTVTGTMTSLNSISTTASYATKGLFGTTTAATGATLQVHSIPSDSGSYSLSSWNGTGNAVSAFIKTSTSNGGSSLSSAEPALVLGRDGVSGQSYANFAEFKLRRWEHNGTNPRTALDIALTHTNGGSGTDIMSLLSNGDVGIGTTSPSARLHAISTTEQFRSGYDSSNYWNATTGSTGITILNGSGSSAGFQFSKNVGIGNTPDVNIPLKISKSHNGTSFVSALEVNSTSPFSGSNLNQYNIRSIYNANNVSGNITNSNLYGIYSEVQKKQQYSLNNLTGIHSNVNMGGAGGILTNASAYEANYFSELSSNSVTNMYFYKANSYVGNSSSTIENMYGLHIGSLKGLGVINSYGIYQTGVNDLNYFAGSVGIGTTTPADKLQVFGDVRLGTTGSNGCIKDYAGTGISGTCSSDERLKTNVVDLSDGYLDKMTDLKVITYNWNEQANTLNKVDTTVTNYGLLAQNVETIFPELVTTDSNGYKQVNYSRLPLYLLKSLQELTKKVIGFADEFKTKKLCVGDTCINEEQLKMLLQNQNIQPAQPTPTPTTVVIPEPTLIPEVVVETISEPETLPDPVVEPIPDPIIEQILEPVVENIVETLPAPETTPVENPITE